MSLVGTRPPTMDEWEKVIAIYLIIYDMDMLFHTPVIEK